MKKDQTITIRINAENKATLEKIARNQERTLSFVVNKIIENWLKENRPPKAVESPESGE